MTTNTGGNGEDDTTSGEDTAVATVEGSSSEDTSPRLSIPSNLWDTGLFKPAWTRPGESGTPDCPPRLKGSLLSRPEDISPQQADAAESVSAHPESAADEDSEDAQEVDDVD